MEEAKFTLDELKTLYDAAIEFRKIEPWKWVKETDIFGVQNPKTNEVGYCCIMGEMGEVLAMAVYNGTEGLNGYQQIRKGQVKPEDPDSLHIQDCLIVSFENKGFVEKEDIQLINKLGYKFRGRNACPMFRSYKPGYFPWFLSRDEVLSMTDALNQAKDVCLRLKENNKMLHAPQKNQYLIRFSETKDGKVIWKDEWREPAPVKIENYSTEPVDEVRVQRIKNSVKQVSAIWEVDFFFAPTPIREGGRPFFPQAIMIADHDTGFIHDMHLAQAATCRKEFAEKFISCIEKTSVIPLEILVRKEDVAKLLEPYTSRLNIKLSRTKKLQNVDNAIKSMIRHFRGF
ncbi:MAG: hypothetical protein COZ31_03035 [Nitrospirae bacterium CG_4_10_14_3_um_filter_44_29]|nr:hypothetical protein [Nitrospirota bacterium]OIO29026.1 MAG: hypothetical protein AUJ60_05985 [Nitrospirae bacterium CG1_02_44_142]PIV44525.1 MAG: hypothetical protein COS28_00265 [Nitrospirae bacterium CG02_land_8_20_14_3_00_44_33]PIV67086.1 MAG: hypothetical protein COS10_02900 [Nitrospirae bacterium CG01_land_8_20_14_3_00_44_22]PIW90043.1 MAG: hypothetical protein COZ93_02485 [Nitrospirae bacterium CG_4_8_14_3_um_filter_44_28]PIX89250.1 MAG: hypothetical protein COZ31_03035 [Nitrospirae 